MSEKHLVTGDPLPPLKEGELHLFTSKFCPYAEPIKLVLTAKGVPYQVINCNLLKKPEFLLKMSPILGKVPITERDGKVLYESEIICNLLEEWYPDVPLYPKDPYLKAKDRLVVSLFYSRARPEYYKFLNAKKKDCVDTEALNLLLQKLDEHMQELKSRGTVFFSGNDAPGMVDFMCWPWIERMLVFHETTELINSKPDLKKYIDDMKKTKLVREVLIPVEKKRAFFESVKAGIPNYDV